MSYASSTPYTARNAHLLDCIVNDKSIAPYGATFEDGYRSACICDPIAQSAVTRRQVDLKY